MFYDNTSKMKLKTGTCKVILINYRFISKFLVVTRHPPLIKLKIIMGNFSFFPKKFISGSLAGLGPAGEMP